MNDTEYHAKIKRLPIGKVPQTHREIMSVEEMNNLLTGEVFIQEKLDGTLVWRQQRDVGNFFENLKIRHTIFYDKLPSFEILLDVTKGDTIVNPIEWSWYWQFSVLVTNIDHDTRMMPSKFQMKLSEYLSHKSVFATDSPIEGIVIKNYEKQLFGKVVNLEFTQGIEDSYLKRRKKEFNRLRI